MITSDLAVVGAGIIGLTTAAAAARRGLTVTVIGDERAGEASTAAAGMLAPSVERTSGAAHEFALAARDRYPTYVEELAEQTGIRVPLNRLGIFQVALTETGVNGLRKTAFPSARWIDRAELAKAEPTLGHALGAMFNPDDGAVDNVTMMRALTALADSMPEVTRFYDTVMGVRHDGKHPGLELSSRNSVQSKFVVIAGGAWSSLLDGLPLTAAITPARGQLIAYDSIGLRHVVYGPRGYLVPRVNLATIAGSTMENVGYDATVTEAGLARIRAASAEIAPALSVTPVQRSWAGLRPVTPDLLPIIGPDPQHPEIIYSCGHSRNGILLAPLSADCVASLLLGEAPAYDLSQFRPERFQGRFTRP